jgi:hypothetical protein
MNGNLRTDDPRFVGPSSVIARQVFVESEFSIRKVGAQAVANRADVNPVLEW